MQLIQNVDKQQNSSKPEQLFQENELINKKDLIKEVKKLTDENSKKLIADKILDEKEEESKTEFIQDKKQEQGENKLNSNPDDI